MTAASATRRQFFMRPVAHVTFLGIMGTFVLVGILIALFDDTARGAGAFVAVFMLFLTAVLYLPLIWYQRVKLTDNGIMVRALGCTVATGWDNLEQFILRPGGSAGIVTRKPMTGSGVERLRRYRNLGYNGIPRHDEDERQWLLEGRYLPLQGFNHAVKNGALQREIAQFSPALPGLHADPAARPVDRSRKALPWWFWVVIALLVGGSVAAGLLMPPAMQQRVGAVLGLLMCVLGSLRVAISAISCWRGQLRLFAMLYALLAVLLALLALAALNGITG
ncbi:MAG: hypothetical protein ABI831_17025 [Betaproteobacteria bacterium]